ncbi:PilI type IV pilus biogenesis protein [Escherichia coli]|nr:PilI type IV pilus biogenesis protein [Escherichia coli]
MPQQHPGRLQVLVVDTHCKRKLFSTKTQTDPDELARRFCTPDNCLVVVLCTMQQPISVPPGTCTR